MALHVDAIMHANELNVRGLTTHNISNRQHYEYLLYTVSRKRRFAKWEKPVNEDKVALLKATYGYSTQKALEVLDLITDEQYEKLKASRNVGGQVGKGVKQP